MVPASHVVQVLRTLGYPPPEIDAPLCTRLGYPADTGSLLPGDCMQGSVGYPCEATANCWSPPTGQYSRNEPPAVGAEDANAEAERQSRTAYIGFGRSCLSPEIAKAVAVRLGGPVLASRLCSDGPQQFGFYEFSSKQAISQVIEARERRTVMGVRVFVSWARHAIRPSPTAAAP
eukprot:TRINITY_DN33240_c0_g1_i1.p2 TRINITY_DN33240_c0_g1~~TRINITY_DN33240_c0_g1_i1.p2  ORF type:complete len:175 (+),score=40.50 TRINITY_DN33240_c0_g1_i1:61-585(+)